MARLSQRGFCIAGLLGAVLGLLALACTTPVVPEAGPPQSTTAPPTTAPPTTTLPTTTLPDGETPPPTITILVPTSTTIPVVSVPGVTDTTIRVGVIADVETGGIADGRSRSAWGGVAAWAEAVNLFGGLGGREIEVVYIDTGLFNHEAAIERACQGDIFAIVGSDALFDHEGLSQLGGEDCPVLDFPAVANSPQRQSRDETFLSNPTPPGVVQVGPLQALAEISPAGVDAAAMILLDDLSTSIIRGEKEIEAALSQGYTTVLEPTTQLTSMLCAPIELYDQITTQGVRSLLWPTDGIWLANFLQAGDPGDTAAEAEDAGSDGSNADAGNTGEEGSGENEDTTSENDPSDGAGSSEAGTDSGTGSQEGTGDPQEQPSPETPAEPSPETPDISPVNCPAESEISESDVSDTRERLNLEFTFCDMTCNRADFSTVLGATAAESANIYLATHLLPIEEAQLNRDLTQYITTLSFLSRADSRLPSEPDLQGVAAWAAARLFEEAVRQAIQPEAGNTFLPLTTQAVLEAVANIDDWDAYGLHAPSNPASKTPTNCFALLKYQDGNWQRQHPSTAGEWDCAPDNLYTLRITGGLQAAGG